MMLLGLWLTLLLIHMFQTTSARTAPETCFLSTTRRTSLDTRNNNNNGCSVPAQFKSKHACHHTGCSRFLCNNKEQRTRAFENTQYQKQLIEERFDTRLCFASSISLPGGEHRSHKKSVTARHDIASAFAVATTSPSAYFLLNAFKWLGSALIGYFLERNVIRDSGILITLALSALICQPCPILNELCWKTFLPASLALLLLSQNESGKDMEALTEDKILEVPRNDTSSINSMKAFEFKKLSRKGQSDDTNFISESIQRLSVPFVLASLGSFVGGILTFLICCYASTIGSNNGAVWSSWFLLPNEARIALSCLTASFIGGSVNFFTTANIILAAPLSSAILNTATTSSLISSMAAADVVVMALYFSLLSAALSSEKLRNWFSNTSKLRISSIPSNDAMNLRYDSPKHSDESDRRKEIGHMQTNHASTNLRPWIVASMTALFVVKFATWAENQLSHIIPGLACAVIAIFTPLIQQSSKAFLPKKWKNWYFENIPEVCRPLSQISLLLLFSSLGSSIGQASMAASTAKATVLKSLGPACVVVSLLALSIHCIFTLFSSWLWRSLKVTGHDSRTARSVANGGYNRKLISFDDVLVASNAAIGGPATAAAFCGRIPHQNDGGDEDGGMSVLFGKGLTYAATCWGIVGYAIGTTIGVFTYQLLGWTMKIFGMA